MKPAQFLYSEQVKEQQAQRNNVTKSIPELRPLPKTANPPKDLNGSLIYSLVQLPVKDGQQEQTIFPQSLISQHLKLDAKQIVGKNTEIARSLKKLKPLEINDASTSTPDSEKAKANKAGEQMSGPKQQVYLKKLNDLTNGAFKKTQSHLLFGSIEPKINHTNVLCLMKIKELKFFNQYDFQNKKIPCMFSWEAVYKKRSLVKTTPKLFLAAQDEILDFAFRRNNYDSVDIILWKIKNNDEKYIGQFQLSCSDFDNSEERLDYRQKVISEKTVEKEMFKTLKQTRAFMGNVSFQLIQLGHDKIPLNRHSGIPGSPRTDEEKLRHRIIDQAMAGNEYRWSINDDEQLQIDLIHKASEELIAQFTIEEVTDQLGQKFILMTSQYADYETTGRYKSNTRAIRKEHFQQVMGILKELDQNGLLTEVQGSLKKAASKGRITKKDIEAALQSVGCSANELLLFAKDDLGMAMMDFLLSEDQLSSVLEAMNDLNLLEENELNLESFATNLFKNIGRHFRHNHNLKALGEFIKALDKKPEIAVLIQNYSYAPENMMNDTPPFLQNFDPKNYEHVMILSKLNKLFKKVDVKTKFTDALVAAHTKAKKDIYFEIPCFPKNQDLEAKKESLELEALGQNIMHEVVRRQKWGKTHVIFEKYSDWFFKPDTLGRTPFFNMINTAPYEVIKQLFTAYPDIMQQQFQQFDPLPPQIESRRNAFVFWNSQEYYKNYLFQLVSNPDQSQTELLEVLRIFEEHCNISGPDSFDMMKKQKNRADNFTPLALYLDLLRQRCKKKLDRVQREMGTSIFICQMLLNEGDEIASGFEISQILSKLPENIFQMLDETFKNIKWIPESFDDVTYTSLPFRQLVKHKQQNKIYQLMTLMNDKVNEVPYDPTEPESDANKLIHYYFQCQSFMLMEIRELKSSKLDQVSTQLMVQLKQWMSNYVEQLFVPTPQQLFQNQEVFKKPPNTLSKMFTLQKFTFLMADLSPEDLDKLDPKDVYAFLNGVPDLSPFKEFITLLEAKDASKCVPFIIRANIPELYDKDTFDTVFSVAKEAKADVDENAEAKPEGEEQLENDFDLSSYFLTQDSWIQAAKFFIVNPKLFQPNYAVILNSLESKSVETILNQFKADLILPLTLVIPKDSKFIVEVHRTIINNLLKGKSLGITSIQAANFIQQNKDKIPESIIQKYVHLFRINNNSSAMQTVLNFEMPTNRYYHNQNKIQPYIYAQGKNWPVRLELKKFQSALKDILPYVDLGFVLYQLAMNGYYEKMEMVLPLVKSPEAIKNAINKMGDFAYYQVQRSLYYYQNCIGLFEYGKEKSTLVRSYDPSVYFFKTSIKPTQVKIQHQIPKFPPELDKIREPVSTNEQLKEMSKGIDEEIENLRQVYLNKFKNLNIEQVERQFQGDLSQFKQLKQWKRSFFGQNLKCFFTPAEREQQSYKKSLDLLLKQFNRYGLPIAQEDPEYHYQSQGTLFTAFMYNLLSVDQLIFQLNQSKMDVEDSILQLLDAICNKLNTDSQLDGNMKIIHKTKYCLQPLLSTFYQNKNFNLYIQAIPKLVKQLTAKYQKDQINSKQKQDQIEGGDENQAEQDQPNLLKGLLNIIALNLTVHKSDNPIFKLSLETYYRLSQQFEEILKTLDEQVLSHIAKQILKYKNIDKNIVAYAQKHAIAEPPKKQRNTRCVEDFLEGAIQEEGKYEHFFKAIIAKNFTLIEQSLKKINSLSTLLKIIDYNTVLAHFGDNLGETFMQMLFKLPIDKETRNNVLELFFNAELLYTLIQRKMSKTYSFLIYGVLYRQIFKSINVQFAQKMLDIIKERWEVINKEGPSQANDDAYDEEEGGSSIAKNKPSNNLDIAEMISGGTFPQMALGLNFFEFFDTITRFGIKTDYSGSGENGAQVQFQVCSRMRMMDEEQQLLLIQYYEKYGYTSLVNITKFYRYLCSTVKKPPGNYFENQLFSIPALANCNTSLSRSLDGRSMNDDLLKSINYYIDAKLQKDWNTEILLTKKVFLLKALGWDKAVKFYPEKYADKEPDWRKIKALKPWLPIDAYLENTEFKTDVQMSNDKFFIQLLTAYMPQPLPTELNLDSCILTSKCIAKYQPNLKGFLELILINFPSLILDEYVFEDINQSVVFINELEMILLLLKSALVVEPKQFESILRLYFSNLQWVFETEVKKRDEEEDEDEDGLEKVQAIRQADQQEDDEEEEEVEQEVEVSDYEEVDDDEEGEEEGGVESKQDGRGQNILQAESKQDGRGQNILQIESKLDDNDDKIEQQAPDDPDGKPGLQQAGKPQLRQEIAYAEEAPDNIEKKKKKIRRVKIVKQMVKVKKTKKQPVFQGNTLLESIQSGGTTVQSYSVLLSLFFMAITNEISFKTLYKVLVDLSMIDKPVAPKQFDKVRVDRLISSGFKEPFNNEFVEKMEANSKQLKALQIEDLKHIKDILEYNELLKRQEYDAVIQLFLKPLLNGSYRLFESTVQLLQNSNALKLINKKKANIFTTSLEKDDRLQVQFKQYFRDQGINIQPDFVNKFFENTTGAASTDKWIATLYFLKYNLSLKEQVNEIITQKYDVKYVHKLQYSFKCKVSNNFESLVMERFREAIPEEEQLPENLLKQKYQFNFDIVVNIMKSNNTSNQYPVPYLYVSKYIEEINKTLDREFYESVYLAIEEQCQLNPFEAVETMSNDQLDLVKLSKFITPDNFRQVEACFQSGVFEITDAVISINAYWKGSIVGDVKNAIMSGIASEFMDPVTIGGVDMFIYSDKFRPDVKLKYLDKLYPVPYSNYQARTRNSIYKQNVSVDLSFPELYPLMKLQKHIYVPEIQPKDAYKQKQDTLANLQRICYDLNSYAGAVSEFVETLPEIEENGSFRLSVPTQGVDWPLLQDRNNNFKSVPEVHPIYMINYLRNSIKIVDIPNYSYCTLAFAEIVLMKLIRVVQATSGKKCKISTGISYLNEWVFLKKLLTKINDMLVDNDFDKFRFYYVEINEIHPNNCYTSKTMKTEGMDSLFRFGLTNFYVHSNVLVIRLNVALVSENAASLLSSCNQKTRNREGSHLLFKEDKEYQAYVSSIVTLEDMLKQIFTKK